jgi:CRISPR-associated endonuclease/helicase Cas3
MSGSIHLIDRREDRSVTTDHHVAALAQQQFLEAWGKLSQVDASGQTEEHPLLDHMLDVAACFMALVQCRGLLRALEGVAERALTDSDVQRLAVLVFLHDLGKVNAGFQAKRWTAAAAPAGWPAQAGHTSEALFLFDGDNAQSADLLDQLPVAAISEWGDAVFALLRASISHHGRPVTVALNGDDAHRWQPVSSQGREVYSPKLTLQQIGLRIQALFPLAFGPVAQPLPETPAFAHLFAGLVQLADWLGSDTRFFPFSAPGEDRASQATERARHAVRTIGIDITDLCASLQASTPDFANIFGVPQPRPIQRALGQPDLGPLLILEAETGSGKTEAALWRFVQLFRAGQVDSLYFALPTRVAASQLYERLRRFVARLWPADGDVIAPVVVRALPGYTSADGSDPPQRLPGFEVLWADHVDDQQAHRRWAAESPKRFLAATIAVGTVDQALLGALQVRHAHLRHTLLARSLLVVDEVHASDAYMSALLEHLLAAHRRAGGQALLLSATLGAMARARYQVLSQVPAIGAARPLPHVPDLASASTLPYPALSDGTRLHGLPTSAAHKTVHWRTLDTISDPTRIAAIAVEAAAAGARVLVVRNTVPAAVATLRAVEALAAEQGHPEWLFTLTPKDGGAPVSTLHHSRFSRQDRPLIDAAVEAQIGKLRAQPGGRIVIGTQTLEQSLDLDADLLLTDLCPMDVLLQRIGRLHRHARPEAERPDGYRQAQAVVLVPAGADLGPCLKRAQHGLGVFRSETGISGVYPDVRMLEATRRLVDAQPTRVIPRDNRELVERATHPEALVLIEQQQGEDWVKLGQELDGTGSAAKTVAHLQALPFDQPFDENLCFQDAEQKVATRLGAADRLVEFEPPQPGPFGELVHQLAIRFHMLPPGLAPDAQAGDVQPLAGSGGFGFTLGARRYRYDRFGLQRLDATASP